MKTVSHLEVCLSGDLSEFLRDAIAICNRRAEYGKCAGTLMPIFPAWAEKERLFESMLREYENANAWKLRFPEYTFPDGIGGVPVLIRNHDESK